MGIKNIHILLITCSVFLAGVFGLWALKHAYLGLGYASLVLGLGLGFYGVNFLKKVKGL